MSIVLYRKYRPQFFAEVVGQDSIIKTLANSVASGKIAHAYLFAGPRGTGKTTVARLLAKAINCANLRQNRETGKGGVSVEPCNKCESCEEIINATAIDVLEIDAASNTGVDSIRELVEGIKFTPARLKYKTYIIDEAHMLSKGAFNALLKTLEEPPEHTVFILATTEAEKIIPTILSRVQRFDFRRQSVPELVMKLKFVVEKEKVEVEEDALKIIASAAQGAFRDAESLLEKLLAAKGRIITEKDAKEAVGLVDMGVVVRFINAAEKNTKEAINILNDLWRDGANISEFTKSVISCLRKALVLKINPDLREIISSDLTEEAVNLILQESEKNDVKKITKMIDVFMEAEEKIKKSPIPTLPLELAVVELSDGS